MLEAQGPTEMKKVPIQCYLMIVPDQYILQFLSAPYRHSGVNSFRLSCTIGILLISDCIQGRYSLLDTLRVCLGGKLHL